MLPTADDYLPGHGDRSFGVEHYELDIDYAVEGNRLDGSAELTVTVLEPTRRVVLDLVGLKASKVRVEGARMRRFDQRQGRLAIVLAEEVAPGTELTVSVRYAGHPSPVVDKHHGDAGWEELTDGAIVAAQPHGAPTWFPCNDRPSDKATYRIAVTAPTGYTVVANGELDGRRRRGSGETWTYVMDRPMATYLATVQIGRYRVTEHATRRGAPTVRTFAPEDLPAGELEGCFDAQPAMMAAFEEWFGPYPFTSYTAVITADDLEIPLESQGLSTFGRNFCSPEWPKVRLIAHELAHQWFGNAVTLAHQRDIWLHEGFACYSEWLWSEESDGPDTCDGWARHYHQRLTDEEQDLLLADPGPELMFDDRVYKRGALALHALRLELGDEAFFALLRAWVQRYDGGSVTTEQFLSFVTETTDVDGQALLAPWLYETDLPPYPG